MNTFQYGHGHLGPALITIPEINSLSSGIMFGTTLYRNQLGIGVKVGGAVGYAIALLTSIVETVAATVFCTFGALVTPVFGDVLFQFSFKWLKSSSFCIIWSVVDFIFNPFMYRMIANEASAKSTAQTGQIMTIPPEAIF